MYVQSPNKRNLQVSKESHLDSSYNMNKRSSNSRNTNECAFANQPRRSKKRGSRKSNEGHESWYCSNDKDRDRDSHEPSEDEVPGLEYTSMFWQQPRLPQPQPHPTHNGQRLFTAMSDPSVCGYSAVPLTYTMEPVSLPPMYRLYQPVVRPSYRPYRGRIRSSASRMHNGSLCSSDTMPNGFSSLQENGWNHSTPVAYQNGDYASLPPTANIDNRDNRDELSSEHRRYSDPGLGPADLPNNSKSDTDSGDSSSSITTVGKSNKLFMTLFQQMTKMKEANGQLFKELHQAKTDLEHIKTELNQFKQNIPSDYQPGMLSDIIKEIRDASRIKEEAMLSKMRLLMESQQSQSPSDLEQLKSQLERVCFEKEESEERIDKLEKEVAALRLSLNSESREIAAFEEENLALRRELQEARASRNLAEGHATKCVNALPSNNRPVMPVNFESPYSPCITSTPVRTTIETSDPHTFTTMSTTNTTAITTTSIVVPSSSSTDLINHDSISSIVSSGSSSFHELPPAMPTQRGQDAAAEKEETVLAPCENDLATMTMTTEQNANVDDEEEDSNKKSSDDDSVVSKEFSILTSRVLTAPSRATYTTAYI